MKKVFILCLVIASLFSCQKKETEAAKKETCTTDTIPAKEEKKFEMYQMSEMAALMEQMYVDNQRLKGKIINGDIRRLVGYRAQVGRIA